MEEVAVYSAQLPDNIEDLTQFVLVGKAKLNAYLLKLQTVNRLSVAQEIRDQTLRETQEISNALIAAEQRIGELLLAIPKASGGDHGNQYTGGKNPDERQIAKTKSDTIKDMGYDRHEASDYQQMAKHPEVVQKVIDDALANGEIVTKSQVMREIKFYKERIQNLSDENKKLKEKEPEIVEKEVIPKDYDALKQKAEMADIHKKDFMTMQKAYEEMAEKWKKSELEKQKLIDESKKPDAERAENIKTSAIMFCAGVSNFIESYGGYVWLTQHINEMQPRERKGFLTAINAIESWVSAIKGNMEDSK